MSICRCLKYFFRFFFLAIFVAGFSVKTEAQQKRSVVIENAGTLERNDDIVPNAQRILNNVRMRHNDMVMWCDSAYQYVGTNRVDAFGNVHINQADTIDLYANMIHYDGDISFARAIGNVRLINKSATLYTDTLDYSLDTNIGYYDDRGKIVDSTNVLTSIIGRYYVNEDIVWFFRDVEGTSDDYVLLSDTVRYNTVTGLIDIYGPTTIRDSLNIIFSEAGWYDSQTGEAKLTKNPVMYNESQKLKGDIIDYKREEGFGKAQGRVEIHDFENDIIVRGNNSWYDEISEIAYMTDSALFIYITNADSLFLHADTLKTIPDTIKDEKIITAYRHAKFYRADMQGKCDSLVYFTRDSTIQMYFNPILWSDINQLVADMIEMKSFADSIPNELRLYNNAFIISEGSPAQFDQIKGKNMVGYIIENRLNYIDVDGNGQTLYYARDSEEDIGLNRAEGSRIRIVFKEGKVNRIKFYTTPNGILKPLFQLGESEKRLEGFDWKDRIRPKSKYDIFKSEEQLINERKTPEPPAEAEAETKETEIKTEAEAP